MRIGEMVLLKLSKDQAFDINSVSAGLYPSRDTLAKEGDLCPMIVTRIHNLAFVNGQVILDGWSRLYYVDEVHLGDEPGQWRRQ
jgi:hypothetical protein